MPLSDVFAPWSDDWTLADDGWVLVADKPVGVATHSDGADAGDLISRLTATLRERGEPAPYLGIHQRLDRDTSGVILLSRRREANAALAAQFEKRRVEKRYVAGVERAPGRGSEGELRHKLAPTHGGSMRALPESARGGQLAVTRWRVSSKAPGRCLLELEPVTGRTHQIRVQLAAVGAPIAGDVRYGGPAARRLMLHARELSLSHPRDGKKHTYRSRVPPELEAWAQGRDHAPLDDASEVERAIRLAAIPRSSLARAERPAAFRLVNGAADGLPGVEIDVYGDHLVVALASDDAMRDKDAVLDACARLGPAGVYLKLRPKHASRIVDARAQDLAPSEPVAGERAPEPMFVREGGLELQVRLGEGLSTGLFLDQRDNRRRIRELAAGARFLNLFAYTGAFTVAAAAGGAASTVSVDVSGGALAWARSNLERNGFAQADVHEMVEADVLSFLRSAVRRRQTWDLVVLDPPSFSTTKQSRFSAETDYRALATDVMKVVAPGGRILACTNHRGIVRAKLRRWLHEAARAAGREVRQMKDMPDPIDFSPEPGQQARMKSVLVWLR